MRELKINLKRILVILMIFVTLSFFFANSLVQAKSKLPSEGEFYYSGTTEGTYTVTEGIFAWLLNNIAGIIDWILGISTMLIRMVFVGWTVLAERLLTWVLESTMNMNMEIGDINSTDVSSNSDSSQNVTVEAIVFGLVPMFDINIFNLTIADNITGTGIDLSKYVCETCGKGIDDCSCTTCDCNLCELREHYNQGTQEGLNGEEVTTKNAVLMVKEAVSKWYYIIRLIAMVAMLMVLIFIGIKMATSTIASDKALYKRMFVDWVVGMIILFSIQYIMVAIISVNDSLVKIIRDASMSSLDTDTAITDVENSPSFNETKKTNASIEISLYEEVRTRAYDPKLINGLSGMVMYMTLVYFAFRFSLVYLKRYFTIIILTLMAPGVAVAYALQKVLTGKSSSFSSWLTEYIMNTIIQVVHAILYASFVSLALRLSLNSISGMIIAFVIMNYMLKAEKLFRKIFKMSSSGSLLEETENAGDPEKLSSAIQGAHGMVMAAKPVTGVLMKTPITQAAIGSVKMVRNASILTGSLAKKKIDEIKEKRIDKYIQEDSNYRTYENEEFKKTPEYKELRDRALLRMHRYTGEKLAIVEQGMESGGYDDQEQEALRAAMYTDQRALNEGETEKERREESRKRWAQYSEVHKANKIFKKATNQTATGVAAAHIGKLLDYNNYYVAHTDEEGKKRVNPIKDRIRGKFVFDDKTRKPVYISGLSNIIKDQLSAEQLLGFTEADKKQAKQVMQFTTQGLLGVSSMFIGLGTFVAHPKLGMPLLAAGVSQTSKMLGTNRKQIKGSQRLKRNVYSEDDVENVYREYDEPLRKQRYTFSRFNSGAMLTMQNTLVDAANDDTTAVEEARKKKIKERHPSFSDNLQKGKVKISTGNYQAQEEMPEPIAPEKLFTPEMDSMYDKVTHEDSSRFVIDSMFGGIGRKMDEVSLSHFKQMKKQVEKEKQVAIVMISEALKEEYTQKLEELEGYIEVPKVAPKAEPILSPTPVPMKTRADIKDVKNVTEIIEVAILESAAKGPGNVLDLDINNSETQKDVKARIESILHEKNGLEKGQHADEIIKGLDSKILDMKAKLDKDAKPTIKPASAPKKVAKERKSIKEILREAATTEESEKEFIKRLTGYDVDEDIGDMEIALEQRAQEQAKTGKVADGSRQVKSPEKIKQDKVVELLLLQKQMRELNEEAIKLKMTPMEANKRYEKARTFVYTDRMQGDRQTRATAKRMEPSSETYYGPVTDIIELINQS